MLENDTVFLICHKSKIKKNSEKIQGGFKELISFVVCLHLDYMRRNLALEPVSL